MLDFDIFAIHTEIDERRGIDREWFPSFEEAMKNRMRFANWFAPKGNVWIKRYHNGNPGAIEEWHINEDGKITSHYDWSKRGE